MYPTVDPLPEDWIPPSGSQTTTNGDQLARQAAFIPLSADDIVRIQLTLSARWARGRFTADQANLEILRLEAGVAELKAQKEFWEARARKLQDENRGHLPHHSETPSGDTQGY